MNPDTNAESTLVPAKALILFAFLALSLALVYFSPLREYLEHLREMKIRIRAMGITGPLAYMAGVFILVSLGFPRLIFCPIGGIIFGFVQGLVWTQVATLAGYYVLFLFVRWGGRDFALRHWPRLNRMHAVLDRSAIPTIIIMRQLPINGLIINLFLGLSRIRHRDFLVGTAIGVLPQAVPFTLVASGAVKLGGGESFLYVIGATAFLLLVWLSFWLIAHKTGLIARLRGELGD